MEQRGLASLLGFYGITPDVDIFIKDFNFPIERLCFLLMAGPGGTGTNTLSGHVVDGSGKEVITFGEFQRDEPEETKRSRQSFALAVLGPKFSGPGTCTFRLLVNGKIHFETTFNLKQGTEENFRQ